VLKKWKLIKSALGYSHPHLKVRLDHVRLPDGTEISDFAVWLSPDVAQVVPLHKDGRVALVRMYKHGAREFITEFPGGFVNDGEDPRAAALRELNEETGLKAAQVELLATVRHHPTKESGRTFLFLARDVAVSDRYAAPDDTEEIEILWVPLQALPDMISSGQIKQTGTIAAAFLALKAIA
jgi:ADP-ribose pyrophosphatase YjhB (NUDIX family)